MMSTFDFSWEIFEEGIEVASGVLPSIEVRPRESRNVSLVLPELNPDKECFLNIYASL